MFLATFIITYGAFGGKFEEKNAKIFGIKIISGFTLLGGLFGYLAFFVFFFYKILFFIPDNWGSLNEDGDWFSARVSISSFCSFIAVALLFSYWRKVLIYIHKIFLPQKIKILLDKLNNLDILKENSSSTIVKNHIEAAILKDRKIVIKKLQNNKSKYPLLYGMIANIAGDLVESGEYHIYRGYLNEEGANLLKLFNDSIDRLTELKAIEKDYANEQKKAIHENIRHAG